MIKIGVVGLGGIAQVMHLPYLTGTEGGGVLGIEVTAVCDINASLAKAIGKRYHVDGVFSDHRRMLRESVIDAVAVLTGGSHASICLDALNAGKHVFVEKPMCLYSGDADRMIEAAESNNVVLQVGYMKNYDPGYLIACEEFSKMTDVFHIDVHKYYPLQGGPHALQAREILRWDLGPEGLYFENPPEMVSRYREETKKQILKEIGEKASDMEVLAYRGLLGTFGHLVNAFLPIWGSPKRIIATDLRRVGTGFSSVYTTSLVDFGEATGVFYFGYLQCRVYDEWVMAYSPTKRVRVDFSNSHLKNRPAIVMISESEEGKTIQKVIEGSYSEAFRNEWDAFVDCVENKKTPKTTGEMGKRVIEICSAMVKCYRTKEPVEL